MYMPAWESPGGKRISIYWAAAGDQAFSLVLTMSLGQILKATLLLPIS